MNRSIQVEGQLQNINFKRFKYREKSKAKVEVILFAVEYNLRKYVHKKYRNVKACNFMNCPLIKF